jgi:hypothetical protein
MDQTTVYLDTVLNVRNTGVVCFRVAVTIHRGLPSHSTNVRRFEFGICSLKNSNRS